MTTRNDSGRSFRGVRVATGNDIALLEEVINRAYVTEAHIVYGSRTDRTDIRSRLATSNTWMLVIDDPQSPVGAPRLAGSVCVDCDGARGHIALLSVQPDLQGFGLGATLVRAAEKHCQSQLCCPVVELEVINLREELFGFYERLGYVRVGTTPFTAHDKLKQPAHLVVMRKASRM
jgi:ribosomal protein S18 acetylase RimI-like enzyme